MSSDKNSHLVAAAKLAKKHGVSNFVAVCPMEQDYAYSEDPQNFFEKTQEAEAQACDTFKGLTLLKTNLAFGRESHMIHFLAQCALVGKCPYKNMLSKDLQYQWAPIHTSDIAEAVGSALDSSKPGKYHLNGNNRYNLR